MIAKILQSARSFQAVYYNEHKVSEQKAVLLAAHNFPTLDTQWDKKQYIDYLKQVASLNPNVKNKQFHAVISTKGQAHSAAELKVIAEQYVQRMGYGDNPYLLYFHQDTQNNHLHIVTTRVNTEGVKIAHGFEKKRSLGHIEGIMKQLSEQKDIGINLEKELLGYQFSSPTQLKMLAEQRGFSTQTTREGTLEILKNGIPIVQIPSALLEKHIAKNQSKAKNTATTERKKMLKAILIKYKTDKTTEELTALMRDKFGVELVFHTSEGKDKPYGYTIIDHSTKSIFKGSEVLKLSEIYELNIEKGTEKGSKMGNKNESENAHKSAIKAIVEPLNEINERVGEQISEQENEQISEQVTEQLNQYLDDHGLYIFEKEGKLHLIDELNNETIDLSDVKNLNDKEHFDFINLDENQLFMDVNNNLSADEFGALYFNDPSENEFEAGMKAHVTLAGADEQDTDRRRKSNQKGVKR